VAVLMTYLLFPGTPDISDALLGTVIARAIVYPP